MSPPKRRAAMLDGPARSKSPAAKRARRAPVAGGGRASLAGDVAGRILAAEREMTAALRGLGLRFGAPVTHVYNPLEYAWAAHAWYVRAFAGGRRRVVFVGMNPGPWGMAQTGVPFGDVSMVRGWMRAPAAALQIGRPARENPSRPIAGWEVSRGEVSGRRLWGWARQRYGEDPMGFFKWGYVHNYCPLVWMNSRGANVTPNKLKKDERLKVAQPCDTALEAVVDILEPEMVIGIGAYAYDRCAEVFRERVEKGLLRVEKILHPSPANPKAQQWGTVVDAQLAEIFGENRLDR